LRNRSGEIPCLQIKAFCTHATRCPDANHTIVFFGKPTPFHRKNFEKGILQRALQGGKMNKSQMIEALAKEEKLPLKKAEEVVNTVFGEIEAALVRGERVEIRGLGSFKVKEYGGYQGRNPKTGEMIKVASKKLPFFKVGKELKERVDLQ
jgi:integration host factor subunit beta